MKRYITGPEYWQNAKRNRYKKLVREGHLVRLLKLVELAKTKQNAANWFAAAASKARWERTLEYLSKLAQVVQTASRVAQKLGTEVTRFIFKQVWSGANVERWADTARETGKNRAKYFAWLCQRELRSA